MPAPWRGLFIWYSQLMYEPDDPKALAKAVVQMLRAPREERACVGHNARARIATMFSLDEVVERYTALYEGARRA